MFALAFDLETNLVRTIHPSRNPTTAYTHIRQLLEGTHGFRWVQGSLYILDNEDMSILFRAIQDLTALAWFPQCVRDIRAFRVEQWSDFTATVKRSIPSPGPSGPQGSSGTGSGTGSSRP